MSNGGVACRCGLVPFEGLDQPGTVWKSSGYDQIKLGLLGSDLDTARFLYGTIRNSYRLDKIGMELLMAHTDKIILVQSRPGLIEVRTD